MQKNQNKIFFDLFSCIYKNFRPNKKLNRLTNIRKENRNNNKRKEIIIREVLEELKTMKEDKIKNLEEIEIEILLLKERIKMRKLWNDLEELKT